MAIHDNDAREARVCERSVFHLPVVYDDLQLIAKDLQRFVRFNGASRGSEGGGDGSNFCAFLNQFILHKWIPRVKAKAQVASERRILGRDLPSVSFTCTSPLSHPTL